MSLRRVLFVLVPVTIAGWLVWRSSSEVQLSSSQAMPLMGATQGGDIATRPPRVAQARQVLGELESLTSLAENAELFVSGTLSSSVPSELVLVFSSSSEAAKEVEVTACGEWSAVLSDGTWSVHAFAAACLDVPLQVSPQRIHIQAGERFSLVLASSQFILGEVIDCLGVPIPEVRVHAEFHSVLTNSSGLFALPVGLDAESTELNVDPTSLPAGLSLPWWQEARAQGRHAIGVPAFSTAEPARIELQVTRRVSGQALLGDGNPMADATLSLRGRFGGNTGEYLVSGPIYVVKTDVHGRFTLDNLPTGRFEAWPFYIPGQPVRPDPVGFEVQCGASETEAMVFDRGLGSAGLYGKAVDGKGRPMPGIGFGIWEMTEGFRYETRSTFPIKATFVTDSGGLVSLEGLPEATYLLVRNQPVVPDQELLYVDQEDFQVIQVGGSASQPFLWVVDGAAPVELRVQLEPLSLSGRLNLEITTEAGVVKTFRKLPKGGEFYFEALPPGEAELFLEVQEDGGADYRTTSLSQTLTAGSSREIQLRF